VFTGAPRRGGRVALEVELVAPGIRCTHSRPYHPQTYGKVEQFHQTQKKWLAAQPPAPTLAVMQRQLDRFRRYYNTVRPHRALSRATPAHAYTTRPKTHPAGPRLPHHYRVRRDRIDTTGVVTLRYNSRLRHIGIGRAHAGTRVLVLVADLYTRVIDAETGQLLRELTLDPDRDYQPTGAPKGPTQPHKTNDPKPE
jgi:Integrase core domain